MARHAYSGVGTWKRFRGRSGTIYERQIVALRQPYPEYPGYTIYQDMIYGKLSSAVPTNDVAVYPVLPVDGTRFFPTGVPYVPCLIYDQLQRCLVADLAGASHFRQPTDTTRRQFWSLPYAGDSGRPVFMVLDDQLVFLFTLTRPTSGSSSPVLNRDRIDACLAPDGAALIEVDLSPDTEF
jgi:hypothetical protein